MSRKQCRRRIWSTDINPIAHAIAGAALTDQTSLDKLRLGELTALESMRTGSGNVQDWTILADMLNITFTFIRNGIGAEALKACQQAEESLRVAALRYEETKRMGLDGPGLQALRDVYEYHDLQRTSVSRSTYERMIAKTQNYLRSKGRHVIEI